MSRIKALSLEAKLSLSHFARLAGFDRATVYKAEQGNSVSELSMHKIAAALSQELERPLAPEDLVTV